METLDDLLIKRRRGALTAAEERRLESALRGSREYELALRAQAAFERDGAALPGDTERLRDLVASVERQLPPLPRAQRTWRSHLHLAAPVFIAGAAAASVGLYGLQPDAPPVQRAPVEAATRAAPAPQLEPQLAPPPPAPEPPAPAEPPPVL